MSRLRPSMDLAHLDRSAMAYHYSIERMIWGERSRNPNRGMRHLVNNKPIPDDDMNGRADGDPEPFPDEWRSDRA